MDHNELAIIQFGSIERPASALNGPAYHGQTKRQIDQAPTAQGPTRRPAIAADRAQAISRHGRLASAPADQPGGRQMKITGPRINWWHLAARQPNLIAAARSMAPDELDLRLTSCKPLRSRLLEARPAERSRSLVSVSAERKSIARRSERLASGPFRGQANDAGGKRCGRQRRLEGQVGRSKGAAHFKARFAADRRRQTRATRFDFQATFAASLRPQFNASVMGAARRRWLHRVLAASAGRAQSGGRNKVKRVRKPALVLLN